MSEAFKSGAGNLIGDCVNAKIESGIISERDKLLILPHNEEVSIKGIEVNGKKKHCAQGEICTLSLNLPSGFDPSWISAGDVICDKIYPVKFVSQFIATIRVFDIPLPLLKGHPVTVHSHFTKVPAKIGKFL